MIDKIIRKRVELFEDVYCHCTCACGIFCGKGNAHWRRCPTTNCYSPSGRRIITALVRNQLLKILKKDLCETSKMIYNYYRNKIEMCANWNKISDGRTEPLHQIRNQSNRCVVKLWTTNHLLNFIPRDWLLTHSLEWSLQYRETCWRFRISDPVHLNGVAWDRPKTSVSSTWQLVRL